MPASIKQLLGITRVEDELVILSRDRYRAILEVQPPSLGLYDWEKCHQFDLAFARLMDGLNFPLQILVRPVPVDLSSLEEKLNQLLAREFMESRIKLLKAYARWLYQAVQQKQVAEKNIYLILGWDAVQVREGALQQAREELDERCRLVQQLARKEGIGIRRLNTIEIFDFLYRCLNPGLAERQEIEWQKFLADGKKEKPWIKLKKPLT